jgi:hypothetical protein
LASRQSNAAVQVQPAPARLSRMFFLTWLSHMVTRVMTKEWWDSKGNLS